MMVTLAILLVGVLALSPFLAGEFMPSFREGHFVAQVSARVPGPNSSAAFADMRRQRSTSSRCSARARSGVGSCRGAGRRHLGRNVGVSYRAETGPPHRPGAMQQELRDSSADILPAVEVLTFLGDRVSETLSKTAQGVIRAAADVRRHRSRDGTPGPEVQSVPGSPMSGCACRALLRALREPPACAAGALWTARRRCSRCTRDGVCRDHRQPGVRRQSGDQHRRAVARRESRRPASLAQTSAALGQRSIHHDR